MLIAETIIPNSLPRTFDYIVPDEMKELITNGMRVVVSFGNRKYTTALVYKLKDSSTLPSENIQLKHIVSIVDTTPSFTPLQFKLWESISSYYQCSLGDIFKNETPAYLKIESETFISINNEIDINNFNLSKNENTIINFLADNKTHSITNISTKLGVKSISRAINSLLSKNIIIMMDNINERYKPRYEKYITLHPSISTEDQINITLENLRKAKKQLHIFNIFLDESELDTTPSTLFSIAKKTLLNKCNSTTTPLNELINKNILSEHDLQVDRLYSSIVTHSTMQLKELSTAQKICLNSIKTSFCNGKRVLLHGVAYSGKTEIYAHLINDSINQKQQALLLVPENALVSQLAQRLRNIFGSSIGVFHNKLSSNEQIELWNDVYHNKKYKLIIGTKTSIFLPFKDLQLIIVDEEHDQKYKQSEINPRYHARNAALFLAHISQSNLILGSATPSIESYTNTLNKKLDLVTLKERYNNTPSPDINLVDMRDIYKKNMLSGHFSFPLINAIQDTLQQKKQIILLQNRRGYASFVECKHCAYIPKCPNCNVSLSVHRNINALKCHYCNHTITMYKNCVQCGSDDINYKGFGTEQVEEEAITLFPEARVKRMDLDSMRKKYSYDSLIYDFNNNDIDILVGTQMIAKGLDFKNVALVGILNADNMLNFPDFRSYEYAFQLMVQTCGRSGRSANKGNVIIQTSTPEHPIFKHIISNNYHQFFAEQMKERELFKYPPYYRLIKITIKHNKENINTSASNIIAKALRESFGDRILGPDSPIIEKINNLYIKNIILKVEINANIAKAKAIISNICLQIRQNKTYSKLNISINIDPT